MQKMMKALMAGGEYKPRPGYQPTEREERDRRALLGSNIFYNPTLELVEIPRQYAVPIRISSEPTRTITAVTQGTANSRA